VGAYCLPGIPTLEFRWVSAVQSVSLFSVRSRTDGRSPRDYFPRMLHKFLTANRELLIERCREKVAKRFEPTERPAAVDHGVPLFLEQLVETLRVEQGTHLRAGQDSEPTPAPTAIGRAAALHGAELLRRGFTVDQVVHDYGDVCQCVTALAVEQATVISVDEFRTLNRCLDNAIADAVAAFGAAHLTSLERKAESLEQRLVVFAAEQLQLIDTAVKLLSAIQTGSIGISGATGMLLAQTLEKMRVLNDRTLPKILIDTPADMAKPGLQ
jgi:hypothetical protein